MFQDVVNASCRIVWAQAEDTDKTSTRDDEIERGRATQGKRLQTLQTQDGESAAEDYFSAKQRPAHQELASQQAAGPCPPSPLGVCVARFQNLTPVMGVEECAASSVHPSRRVVVFADKKKKKQKKKKKKSGGGVFGCCSAKAPASPGTRTP